MRGGTESDRTNAIKGKGLSPHARGNPVPIVPLVGVFGPIPHARGNRIGVDFHGHLIGPIPACAGEPAPGPGCWVPRRAYPRMRGGTCELGSTRTSGMGLSPHARGNLTVLQQSECPLGPIPACAGEPWCGSRLGFLWGAYPRMRGGTKALAAQLLGTSGLSPHARGNQSRGAAGRRSTRPIPACAGEP